MKLHVVGAGVLGKATGKAFARFGHEVTYTDVGDNHGAVPADIHFICTPESAAPQCVREVDQGTRGRQLNSSLRYMQELIVIRSTVPPGTTLALAKELGTVLCHVPEFLREATAEQDVLNADRWLVGTTGGYPRQILAVLAPFQVPIIWATSTETELAKLLTNNYLATLLSFWDEAKALCEAAGVNSHAVARLVALDDRVASYGANMHGTPYTDTKCLPKDLKQSIDFAKLKGIDVRLLEAVRDVDKALNA